MHLSFSRLPPRLVRIAGIVVAAACVALMLLVASYGFRSIDDRSNEQIEWSHELRRTEEGRTSEGVGAGGSDGGSSGPESQAPLESEYADVFNFPLPAPTIEVIEHSDAGAGAGAGGMRTEIAWVRVDAGVEERGLVLLFHGCSHSAASWFTLPEDRLNCRVLRSHNYSLLAFSSQDRRRRRCWDDAWPIDDRRNNVDVESVLATLRVWIGRAAHANHTSTRSPRIFAFGASSGGTFVTILARAIKLQAAIVMISPGNEEALMAVAVAAAAAVAPPAATAPSSPPPPPPSPPPLTLLDSSVLSSSATLFPLPPTLFICMERDTTWASSRVLRWTRTVILASNPHLRAGASAPSSSSPESDAGSDAVAVWTIPPRALTAHTLLSIDSIRTDAPACADIFHALAHAHSPRLRLAAAQSGLRSQESPPSKQQEGDDDADEQDTDTDRDTLLHPRTDMLRSDPRGSAPIAVVQALLQQLLQASTEDQPLPLPLPGLPLRFSPPSLALSVKRYSHQTLLRCSAVFERESAAIMQLLNERYASHEMSGRMSRQQAQWMDRR